MLQNLSSTKVSKVIPALTDIYNADGNPETQLSDNGPPFKQQSNNSPIDQKNITLFL